MNSVGRGEMPGQVEARHGNYPHLHIANVTMSALAFPNSVRGGSFVSRLLRLWPYVRVRLSPGADPRIHAGRRPLHLV